MGSGQEGVTEGWWAEPEVACKQATAGEGRYRPECGMQGCLTRKRQVGLTKLRSGDRAASCVRGRGAETFWHPDRDLRKAEIQPFVSFGWGPKANILARIPDPSGMEFL